MTRKEKLTGSKDALLLEGIGMAGVGAVAVCYPGPEMDRLLPPIGLLLFLHGAGRLLFGVWIFQSGSDWRRLLHQSGWADMLTGAAALAFAILHIPAAIELIATWLVLSGYYHLRRSALLNVERNGRAPLEILGLLSIGIGLLFWGNILTGWISFVHYFSLAIIPLGIAKIYGFIKLGRMRGRLKRDEEKLAAAGEGD